MKTTEKWANIIQCYTILRVVNTRQKEAEYSEFMV